MELSENIAEISLEPQAHKVKHITLHFFTIDSNANVAPYSAVNWTVQSLRQGTLNAAKRLGDVKLTFLMSINRLKSTANGSCVYLELDAEKQTYECVVYNNQPTLCRLYPFQFEKTNANDFILQIPSCVGLNLRCGEIINEAFIIGKLLDVLKAFYS